MKKKAKETKRPICIGDCVTFQTGPNVGDLWFVGTVVEVSKNADGEIEAVKVEGVQPGQLYRRTWGGGPVKTTPPSVAWWWVHVSDVRRLVREKP